MTAAEIFGLAFVIFYVAVIFGIALTSAKAKPPLSQGNSNLPPCPQCGGIGGMHIKACAVMRARLAQGSWRYIEDLEPKQDELKGEPV